MTKAHIDLRRARAAIASLLCGCLLTPSLVQGAALGGSFFDNFDKLDSKRWYASDGWSNGSFTNCGWVGSQVTVKNGILNVGFAKGTASGKPYSCGEIRTRQEFSYGTYEARLKTPKGSGLNAAFFTYTGPTMNRPHDEIDYETLIKDTSQTTTTTFVNNKSGDGTPGHGNGMHLALPYPSDSDFLDMAFIWTADRLDFYINRKLVRSITARNEIPTSPQNIFFSLWGSDTSKDWLGAFEDPGKPIAMQVDWFGYTVPGETCTFPDSILCTLKAPS